MRRASWRAHRRYKPPRSGASSPPKSGGGSGVRKRRAEVAVAPMSSHRQAEGAKSGRTQRGRAVERSRHDRVRIRGSTAMDTPNWLIALAVTLTLSCRLSRRTMSPRGRAPRACCCRPRAPAVAKVEPDGLSKDVVGRGACADLEVRARCAVSTRPRAATAATTRRISPPGLRPPPIPTRNSLARIPDRRCSRGRRAANTPFGQ